MIFTQNTQLSGFPTESELELINKYSIKPLEARDVYVFSLVLCDNEVDRDFERFDIPALKTLAGLFVGKTGIFDHSMSGRDQTARIFSCETLEDSDRLTAAGEVYTKLCARAYMPRSEKNDQLIKDIDAGIKKETSVGCSVKSRICSVCGIDARREGCAHIKGRTYSGKTCHEILSEPTDAYEWSFVAVPAQPAAGVTKSCPQGGGDALRIVKRLGEGDSDILLSKQDAQAVGSYIAQLEELARRGREYREELLCDVVRLGAAALPAMRGESLRQICASLDLEQLRDLKKALGSGGRLKSQLAPAESPAAKNDEFKI